MGEDRLHPPPADLVGEARRGAGEDEAADPLRIAPGPGDGDEAAVGVAEQVELVEAEVLAHDLDVGHIVLEVVFGGVRRPAGVTGAARVEQQQRALGRQLRQLAEVQRGVAGPPGWQNRNGAVAHLSPGEGPIVTSPQTRHRHKLAFRVVRSRSTQRRFT